MAQEVETHSVPLDDAKVDMSTYLAARDKGNTATIELPVEKETPKQEPAGAQAEEGSEDSAEHPGSKEGKSQAETEDDSLTAAQQAALDKRIKRELRKLNEQFEERLTSELDKRTPRSEATKETPKAATAPPDPNDPEPELEKFSTHEDWVKAHGRWAARDERRQADFREASQVATEREREVITAHTTRLRAAQEKYPDFTEKVGKINGPWPDSRDPSAAAFVNAMYESEDGPEIAYHLANHPEEFAKFEGLTPSQVIRQVEKVSASLLPSGSQEKSPKEKKPAPPEPITPVGGGSSKSSAPLEKADMASYLKRREAGETR